jgi:GntR family transcriptional regulator
MATEYGVAYDTIRRATAVLRERGLITTIVGRGTFVTAQSS